VVRLEAFHAWLDRAFPNKRTSGSRKSEASRVELAYGDLDKHYAEDRLEALIDGLSYSSKDERQDAPNPTSIPIDGNIRNGLASLRQSLRCYQRFADQQLKL
jgi:hypothetical protein